MNEVTVSWAGEGKYTQRVETGRHTFLVDEPPDVGDDRGPNPYELLLAALGACTSMTIRMYAEHKKMKLDGVSVRLTYNRDYAKDCEDCENTKRRVHRIEREITLTGDLSPDEKERLRQIAERCAIHRTLVEEKEISTTVV